MALVAGDNRSTMLAAMSPRLKNGPDQQMLILTNQIDENQVRTTLFPDFPRWVNAARRSYCDLNGSNGIRHSSSAIPSIPM